MTGAGGRGDPADPDAAGEAGGAGGDPLPDRLGAIREIRDLPVVEVLDGTRGALAADGTAVLVAPPGAGKTTVVPLALLDEPWLEGRKIVVLEPRRLAARAAADRMATLLGEDGAGGTVGYRVRMDTRVSSRTRIEVVTEGVLTRMLQGDPALTGVGAVIFDEFHERSLPADMGLALALQSRALFRDDLRLLVMSATIDPAPVAALLDPREGRSAPVLASEGRTWEVETRFRSRPVEGWIEPPAVEAVLEALERDEGDVLVFLPGAGEIRRTESRLADAGLPGEVEVHPLYGNLSRRDQDRAIAPSGPGRRKVVLATSIAETSLTIEGVRVVVDAGLMRVPRFDPGTGMTRLETVRVTRDAADQRRGRAGRTAPGVCYRLWTRGEDRGLVPHRRPELLEADLAPLALELAVWGAAPGELRWLDPPPEAAHAQAMELLRELEAVEEDGAVTAHGREMAGLGLHPRLAHMLLVAKAEGRGPLGCDLAALLGERDVLRGEGRAPDADLRLRVEALKRGRSGRGVPGSVRGQRVDRGGLRRALREAAHWRRNLGLRRNAEWPDDALDRLGDLCAAAYPDRVGRRRDGSGASGASGASGDPGDGAPGEGRYLLRNGRGARFAESQPLSRSRWLVAVEVEGSGRDARIFRAAPVTREEVEERFRDQIETEEEVAWDAAGGLVRARRRSVLGALVMGEAPLRDPDPAAISRALLEGVREAGLEVLPWDRDTEQLRERLAFLHRLEPDGWPDTSDDALLERLEEWLGPFVAGMKRLTDLARLELAEALLTGVSRKARQRLEAWAPSHLEVPSGSRIRLDYSDPDAPALAVRLQEVFGLTETPRIAGGRVPLTLHLLSPAHRPVQVTRDLASFWRDAYFEVRKDLRGRYPKHPWPEDPLDAPATRRTKRRS